MYTEYMEKLMQYLQETKVYVTDNTVCDSYESAIQILVNLFSDIKKNGKQVFFIGNGGSAGIAGHMAADFMKNGGMKTYSLYDHPLTTCMGNDYGYEYIFSRPLEFLGNPGDLLVAISSSGNSQNIVNAIQVARTRKMKVITFSGFEKDNKIVGMGDCNLYVPVSHFGMVESIHNLILQHVVDVIWERDGVCL